MFSEWPQAEETENLNEQLFNPEKLSFVRVKEHEIFDTLYDSDDGSLLTKSVDIVS